MTHSRLPIKTDQATADKIAARRAHGATIKDLVTEFGYANTVINRMLELPSSREIIKSIHHDIVSLEIAQSRRACSELLPMAIEVVKAKLLEGDLKSAELVFRVSGMLTPTDNKDAGKSQSIQIILPGQREMKEVVNVERETPLGSEVSSVQEENV